MEDTLDYILVKFDFGFAVSEEETPNFRLYEFYVKSVPHQEFMYPKCLPLAGQIIRDWMNKVCGIENYSLDVTSCFLDYPGQLGHSACRACDFRPSGHLKDGTHPPKSPEEIILMFRHEVLNLVAGVGSEVIDKLRAIGITGFGLEPACIHLDCGGYGFNKRIHHQDKYGTYTIFEWNYSGLNRSI